MMKVSSLCHQIGGTKIIKDVTFEIPKGQVTALIGPNGAGKTTLLRLLAAQDPVQQGQITLDGQVIGAIARDDLARRMAVVAQQVGVASRLRIRDLIGFGRWPHNRVLVTHKDTQIIEQALAEFDLVGLADRYLDEVTGGQRQRAFVAMAYAQDTDWLMLDEPLNNLDLRYARRLMQELHRLATGAGKSVVIVLHDLNYAVQWADHVVALKAGRLAFSGPATEVMRTEVLSDIYNSDVQVLQGEGGPFVAHPR